MMNKGFMMKITAAFAAMAVVSGTSKRDYQFTGKQNRKSSENCINWSMKSTAKK